MPYYNVKFRYVDRSNKIARDHVRVDADNAADAKAKVIRGEKPRRVAVDSVKRV